VTQHFRSAPSSSFFLSSPLSGLNSTPHTLRGEGVGFRPEKSESKEEEEEEEEEEKTEEEMGEEEKTEEEMGVGCPRRSWA
jgi:hypothetical protein